MKALASYKTVKSIKDDLQKESVVLEEECYAIIGKDKRDSWGWYDREQIYFSVEESVFSCAIDEIGNFNFNKNLDKYWPYLLKANLILHKPEYLRCSTLATKEYEELNDALQQVGFLPVTQLRSNHGRYKVLLWEWWK